MSSLSQSGQQSFNVMHRVWESSSALITAISTKIKSLSGKKAPLQLADDDGRRADKALDSAKIQIRLLYAEDDLKGIRKIAEETEDHDLAAYAISYLIENEPERFVPHLHHISQSDSAACMPALICLFNNGQADRAQTILMDRLLRNEYFQLISQRKINPKLLLDVLGAVDDCDQTNLALQYFPQIWASLGSDALAQENLLAEILGDQNPGGLRYAPDKNMVPQGVKIQTLQLLHALKPKNYNRCLWYASRDDDDVVAYTATMAATEFWQGEGAVPESLEPFPMLNLNLLFYLSKLASTFKWQGPTGVMELHEQWTKDLEELDSIDQQQEQVRYLTLKKKTEVTRAQLVDITEKRLNTLQPIVDAVTKSLRLPHAKIRPNEVDGTAAAYLVGTGTVEFSKSTLLDDKPLTEEFMSSMLHELGHMEQDVLIIRMIADEIGLKFGQHGAKLKVLFEHYSNAIGYAPDSIFLLEVLRLRADKPLTPEEKQRAQRLMQAAYENLFISKKGKRVTERIARVEDSIAALDSGSYDEHLLECLRDERSLKPLFENGYVPGVLIEEMRNCKLMIDEIADQMAAALGQTRRGKTDSISLAQQLLQTEDGEQVQQVVHRFRIVVSHMLSEECRRLEIQLSEIRRAGYHEAEAYTISDRVEVIVKALRKGWYEFTS